jgi:membrane dipeptidase
MGELGFILDVSHMDELAVLQSLDRFPGKIVATHANALSLLQDSNSNRHLSDRVIRGLIERDGVIGVVPKNDFLKEGWKRGHKRDLVSISDCVDHIDHICQLAGSAHNVAIGSDFDGGFGLQSVPPEIDTIADLQIVGNLLHTRGYYEDEISAIMGMNWISVLEECLPKD